MYTYRIRAHPQYIVHTVAHANIHKQVVYSTNTITILLHTLEKGWEVFVPPEQTMVTTDKHILNKWVQVYDLANRKDWPPPPPTNTYLYGLFFVTFFCVRLT